MDDWQQRLFVYGTLAPEQAPEDMREVVARLSRLGPATLAGRLYGFEDYPGVILDTHGKSLVHGTLFQLPDDPAVLAAIDEYELYDPDKLRDSLFVRQRVEVRFVGQQIACWAYLYNQSVAGAKLIESGDYRAWREHGH